MHLKFHFKLIAVLFCFGSAYSGFFSRNEYIKLFEADITVQQDGDMRVIEYITVKTDQDKIKRGIFRSIPTDYSTGLVNRTVKLTVLKVLLNNLPVRYVLEKAFNGKIIKIGDAKMLLSPGTYTYTIEYTLSRQLGFYDEQGKSWAELYFNIVGNGWPFYIEKSRARIHLPQGIKPTDLHFEAYTGLFGYKEKNYQAYVESSGTIVFESTSGLNPHEGFTVVVTWPRGFVAEPTLWQKFIFLLNDNFWALWYLLGALILLIFYLIVYRKEKNKLKTLTVIPLFHPPAHLTPGAVRYINQKKFDNTSFAADIVDMAVHGFLDINQKKGWLSSEYELIKREPEISLRTLSHDRILFYQTLHKNLFSRQDKVLLGQSNNTVVRKAVEQVESTYALHYSYDYFNFNSEYTLTGLMIGIFSLCIPIFFDSDITHKPIFFIAIALYAVIIFIFYILLKMYTPAGAKIANEIKGFKMYLETAESERLKFLSTPPAKTPELYETLLPYAIALGVEEAWSKQFVPVFEQLKAQGMPYMPLWYHGNLATFKPHAFASQLNSALNTSISSSVRAPGTYSGSSGRGSSGGGGGGGGGGGW